MNLEFRIKILYRCQKSVFSFHSFNSDFSLFSIRVLKKHSTNNEIVTVDILLRTVDCNRLRILRVSCFQHTSIVLNYDIIWIIGSISCAGVVDIKFAHQLRSNQNSTKSGLLKHLHFHSCAYVWVSFF